jgi:hypothetical protein
LNTPHPHRKPVIGNEDPATGHVVIVVSHQCADKQATMIYNVPSIIQSLTQIPCNYSNKVASGILYFNTGNDSDDIEIAVRGQPQN